MPEKPRVQDLKALAARAKDATAQMRDKAIEEYWPTVEGLLRERVGPAALALARDDEKLARIARSIYPALPRSLRFFVGETQFLTFCRTHRGRLLHLAEDAGESTSGEPNADRPSV